MKTATNTLALCSFLISVIGLTSAAYANNDLPQHGADPALSQWENTALYEPCMNGGVSAGGLYPSQITEDKSNATLGVLARP